MRPKWLSQRDIGVLLAGLAATLLVVGILVVAGMPLVSFTTIAAFAYGCVASVMGFGLSAGARIIKPAGEPRAAPSYRPAMVRRVPGLTSPAVVRVAAAEGTCPLRYRVGDSWTVAENGRLSPAVCQPAASAMGVLFANRRASRTNGSAQCTCPAGAQRLTFVMN